MTEQNFLKEKAKTCCFSGHRSLDKNFSSKSLEIVVEKLIKDGFNTFLIGMAIGFDTVCFNVLEKLKSKYDFKIVACIPHPDQPKNFTKQQHAKYCEMLEKVDEKVYVSDKYTNYCMIKRNKYMIDNSCLLVCYLRHDYGGTFKTFNYAVEQNVPVIRI